MKTRAAIISLFAVILFTGISNAQSSGRVYIATDAGVYVQAVRSGELPTLNLTASQPIKVRIIGRSGTGKTMSASLPAKMYGTQIPCGPGGGAAGARHEYFLDKVKNVNLLDTQAAWRGTCQLLSIKLGADPEYRAKVRFQ